MSGTVCPICRHDLDSAVRLFGQGVIGYHKRVHQLELLAGIVDTAREVAKRGNPRMKAVVSKYDTAIKKLEGW